MTTPIFTGLLIVAVIAMVAGPPMFFARNYKVASIGIIMAFGGLVLFFGSVAFALLA